MRESDFSKVLQLPPARCWLTAAIMTGSVLSLSGCGSAPRPFQPSTVYQPPEAAPACTELGCPIGYAAPPERLTVASELQREFDRCLAIGASADCVREAFAAVKKSQGLDERTPTGTVTIRKLPPTETDN